MVTTLVAQKMQLKYINEISMYFQNGISVLKIYLLEFSAKVEYSEKQYKYYYMSFLYCFLKNLLASILLLTEATVLKKQINFIEHLV